MQEKALSESEGDDYLAGSNAPIDGWVASSLRGENRDGLGTWSEAELAEFLKTGRNDKSVVFGGMSDVVEHSLQYLSDDDITAIARYLKSLPPRGGKQTPAPVEDSVAKDLWKGNDSKTGAALYVDNCAACHRTDGAGYKRAFPSLKGQPGGTDRRCHFAYPYRSDREHHAGGERCGLQPDHAVVRLASGRPAGGGCGQLHPHQLGQQCAGGQRQRCGEGA